MRAARMHGYNEPLPLEEIPVPDFGPDEVLVKVAAAGMCRSDFQLVEGVTGFTNGEEQAVGLTDVVPFLVEDELIRLGANYEKVADWEPYVVTDGLLITGQNPASAQSAAETLLRQAWLRRLRRAPRASRGRVLAGVVDSRQHLGCDVGAGANG
jgi:hypothetical protein